MNLVMDANAIIAYLEDEPGGDVVEEIMDSSTDHCYIHSANLCEVYYGVYREYGPQAATETVTQLHNSGIFMREDMDEDFWKEAGKLKAQYRRISLADCFCAALANRIDGIIISADKEFEPLATAGICRVKFIR